MLARMSRSLAPALLLFVAVPELAALALASAVCSLALGMLRRMPAPPRAVC
jgi:hypothetical protein